MELSQAYLSEDTGPHLARFAAAFAGLTTLFIALRHHAKRFTGAKSGVGDVFLIVAYILNLGMCALGIVMVKVGGVGRHIEFVKASNPQLITNWAQCILAFEIVYFSSVAFPKMAILCLYLRVFNWQGPMRWAALALLAVVAATGLSLVVTACFQCRPMAFWWDRTIPGGTCIDVQAFFRASSIPQFVLDFFIMVLPLRTIWGLKLPTHKRIALLMIFVVASFGVVASIIRAITFFGTSAFADETFASVELVGWSIIETGTYIIAACLPHLRPLFAHWAPQFLKDMVRKTVSYGSNGLSKNREVLRRGGDDDQIELTGSTKVEDLAAIGEADEAGWEVDGRSKSTVASAKSEREIRASVNMFDRREWNEDDDSLNIRVTNEVTVESSSRSRRGV